MSIKCNPQKKEIYFILAYTMYLLRELIGTSTIKQYINIDGSVYWGIRIALFIFVFLNFSRLKKPFLS